ncbi:MAG: Co2+/Mg2+ efflux protein ApaG [Rickettsiales bacterium]|nr:Co2+/Mg2+ efflux protein ApaG [Rickettsiales bacterium]
MTFASRFNQISGGSIKLTEEILSIKPYCAVTNNVSISVWPEFIDHKISSAENLYVWAYHIIIENKSPSKMQLMNRHWKIIDEKGLIQEISGEGVIGQKPIINPNSSFQYTSGVHLNHPSGIMSGKYEMKKNEEEFFYVEIPSFSLDIPNIKSSLH